MIIDLLSKLLPFAAVGLLALVDLLASFAIVIILSTAEGSELTTMTVAIVSGLSMLANFLVCGWALWIGSRGFATLGLIAGHTAAVVFLTMLCCTLWTKRSVGTPSGRGRSWMQGPLGALWIVAIAVSFLAVDGLLLTPLWRHAHR